MHHATGEADCPKAFDPTSSPRPGRRLPGHLVRLRLRDDWRDADHPAGGLWDPEQDRRRRLRSRFSPTTSSGCGRPSWTPSGFCSSAALVSADRGCGWSACWSWRRSRSWAPPIRRRRCRWWWPGPCSWAFRRHLRHRHRRVSNRAARTTTAGRRVGHVAGRVADWRRVGRRAGAGDRRAIRLGRRLCGLCAVRAAGDARRLRHGRTGAPAATRPAGEPRRTPWWPISARSPSSCGARARRSC